MNKNKIFSSVIVLLSFSLTGSTVLAGHSNPLPASVYRALLRAQVAQPAVSATPKKKKGGAGVVKMVNQLMHDGPNSFWRKWEELALWEDGPPDEEEAQEGMNLINSVIAQIKALTPTTKKETKAVARAIKELERERRNLGEQLFRAAKLEPLREQMQDLWDMEEDWQDPNTIAAKLNKFKEMAAAWAAIEKEAKQYRHLGNEVKNELKNIAENIRNLEENLTNAQREQNRQYEPASPTEGPVLIPEAPNAVKQLMDTPGFDEVVKQLYAANTPAACANVSFDNCGSVMMQLARSGGDLMPFANLIIQAAQQIGRTDVTIQQIIEELQRTAQQQASVYQALRRRARVR